MVARIRTVCLSATLLATATAASTAFADDFFFPARNCAIDRSAPAMSGPFQLTVDYSDKAAYTIDPKYINDLGPNDALSLEFAFGTKTFRAASTWGHALAENLFFKASAEYFAQMPEFEFASGTESIWTGEWGVGTDFKYRIDGLRGLDSVHFALQYINANGQELETKPYTVGLNTLNNFRALRGGKELGADLGVRIQPWNSAYVDLDLYYDQNTFSRTYEKDDDAIGFGAGATFHQNIGERFQFFIGGADRRPYYEYLAGVRWIARHSAGSLLELGMQFSVDGEDLPFTKENRLGVGLYYSWGGDVYSSPVIYHDPLNRGMRQDLVDYTNVPVVRPPQVLVTRDETSTP